MSRIENVLMRLVVLAAVLFVVVYFMLDKKFGTPSELEEPSKYIILTEPKERGMDRASLAPVSIDSAEIGEFEYGPPAFRPAFGARNKEARLLLSKLYGGGDDTENAVEMGLVYLAGIQNEDGSWSSQNQPVGSTGLAMLCFLGAGYHHMGGDHKEVVEKGLQYLLDNQTDEGGMKNGQLYTYGIAGTAFAEGYGLTGDPRMKEAALKMMDYLARGQGPKGGWGYNPYKEGVGADAYRYDTSVTGWVVMFFKSAYMVGLPIPKETISKYKEYALLVTDNDGVSYYAIDNGKLITPLESMTALTLMCRLHMGEGLNAKLVRPGLDKLTKSLKKDLRPRWIEKDNSMDNYLWYHAAQAAFLAGDRPWEQWNNMLKDLLVKNQIKNGLKKGAWEGRYFKYGDKSDVYATALNIMILETYYRYYR